jgi:hypothetical protein
MKSNSLGIKINALFRQSVGCQSKSKSRGLRKSLLNNYNSNNDNNNNSDNISNDNNNSDNKNNELISSDKFLPVDIISSVNNKKISIIENDNNIEEKLIKDFANHENRLTDEMRESKSFSIDISNDARDRSSSGKRRVSVNYLKEIARVAAEIMGKDTNISVSRGKKDTKINGEDDFVVFDLTGDSVSENGENRSRSSGFGSSIPFMSSVSKIFIIIIIIYYYFYN